MLNASLFALLVAPWQAPDEPGHFEYACLLSQLGRPLQGRDRSLALQQAIIASLVRNDFWPLVREPQPNPLPASFAADPFLLRSASQVGDEPPTYYIAPAAICRLPLSIEAQARWMRLYGAVLFGLSAAATAWGWAGGRQALLAAAVGRLHPLFLALLPMAAFIAGSINNDSLALLTATLVFAAVLRIQRLGWTWQRGLGLAALLALALASKKTNIFLLLWLGMLALAALWRWLGRQGWSQRRRFTLASAVIAVVLIILLLPTPLPGSWRGVGQLPGGGRVEVELPDGPGWAALVVDRSLRNAGRLTQNLDQPEIAALRGQAIAAAMLVRSADGRPAPGRLLLRDTASASQTDFVAGEQWQLVRVQHTLAMTTSHVNLVVAPGRGLTPEETGQLLVAKAAVWLVGETDETASLLANSEFRAAARLGEVLASPLRNRWRQFAPQAFIDQETAARNLLYLALTFAGFWGNFGWLQAPLPVALYALLAAVTAAAGVGVWLRWRRDAMLRPILVAWLLAFALIALQTFLPMIGRDWQPQGRYLFPALLPITGLLVVGLDHWLRFGAHRQRVFGLALVLLAFNLLGLATAARLL